MNRRRVYAWVTLCYAQIVLSWLFAAGILGGVLWVLSSEYLKVAGTVGMVISFVSGFLGFLLAWRLYDLVDMIFRKEEKPSPEHKERVQRIVAELASERNVHVPDIVLITPETLEKPANRVLRWLIGILDKPGANDTILVGIDALDKLSDAELKSVLAHEMRHSNALENRMTTIVVGLSLSIAFLSLFGGLHYLLIGMFSSKLTMLAALSGLFLAWVLRKVGSFSASIAMASMSRATEHKTDALACLDIGTPEHLISALDKLVDGMITAYGKPAPERSSLMRSHPTNEERRKVLLGLR